SSNAVKTYVDSFITISPASANNPTGATHVLTINVFDNAGDGKGYVAAPNGTPVSVAILSGPGSFIGASTCTTTNGACTVSTTSGSGGTDTYQATTTPTVGGVTMKRT